MTNRPPHVDPELMARLKAEAKAPYRGLRRVFYGTFAASGAIGGFIFLLKLLAGGDPGEVLPNLALQAGVVALMIWLFRIDRPRGDRDRAPRG
jgi:hypothetical protein